MSQLHEDPNATPSEESAAAGAEPATVDLAIPDIATAELSITESVAAESEQGPGEEDHFEQVPAPFRKAIERRGFASLTSVQNRVLAAPEGANLRVSSQTGSGKTVALGLVIGRELLKRSPGEKIGGPIAVVIAPTRELATQVHSELQWLFGELNWLRTDVVTGGTEVRGDRRRLSRPPHVLVATPGRLLDHLRTGVVDATHVLHVILDEADQMLDLGFKDELDAIVAAMPEQRASHLVSATFPAEVESLARRFQGESVQVQGTRLGAANQDIEHVAHLVFPRSRYMALVNVLLQAHGDRCLIFVQKRSDAAEVAEMLSADGFRALPFSGELPQAQRTRTLSAFRSATVNILVSTDVAARGIDVPGINLVIHAEPPRDPDTYTHRSGRTGRAGHKGRSVLLVPIAAERRVRFLLQRARIEVSWLPVATAKRINKEVVKATRREMFKQLEGFEPDETQLNYARHLLTEQPPERVVATLLQMAQTELPCKPREFEQPEIRPPSEGSNSFGRGYRDGGNRFRGAPRNDRRWPSKANGRGDGRARFAEGGADMRRPTRFKGKPKARKAKG